MKHRNVTNVTPCDLDFLVTKKGCILYNASQLRKCFHIHFVMVPSKSFQKCTYHKPFFRAAATLHDVFNLPQAIKHDRNPVHIC